MKKAPEQRAVEWSNRSYAASLKQRDYVMDANGPVLGPWRQVASVILAHSDRRAWMAFVGEECIRKGCRTSDEAIAHAWIGVPKPITKKGAADA